MADCTVVSIDECVRRGDSKELTITIPNRDLTSPAVDIYFTGKEDRTLTSGRYIDLNNGTGGGLTVAFSSPDSIITVSLVPEDTQDITFDTLQVDVQVDNPLDAEDIETVADGTLTIVKDVRTEFDNYDLPVDPVVFQQVDASDFEVNSLMWVQEVGGERTMVEITIAELKTELGI